MTEKRIRVREGDLFKVQVNHEVVAVGIVLHVSRRFGEAILVGFYRQLFTPNALIDESLLGGPFIDIPNYASRKTITVSRRWPLVGHSDALLSEAEIPHLNVAGHLYYKDELVRALELHEYSQFQTLSGRGYIVVENEIREALTHLGLLPEEK